ncbi:hypothetical protein A2U01_0048136, partial [Trifolium medium]|nr:hypothetical protein [Trifolium medium]
MQQQPWHIPLALPKIA